MQLPKQYPYAVAVALGMSLHAWTLGFNVGKLRKQIFNQDFMKKQFEAVHQKQLNEPIKLGGYPDTGSGFYSRKLSYRDWYRFNIAQRIHLNYVEIMNLAQSSVLAAGIYKPKQAAAVGLCFIFARWLFAISYNKKGGALNKGRIAGAALSLLSILINVGIFGVQIYKKLKN